jgi:alpha-glucosidase
LDYQKDICSGTGFACATLPSGKYTTDIVPEDKGFTQSGKRNILLKYHLAAKPANVFVNGKAVKSVKKTTIADAVERDITSVWWSWDEAGKECLVKIPDKRESVLIELNK